MIYNSVGSSFAWFTNASATARMSLNATALYIGGATVPPSDKSLKFNKKPMNNALGVMNQLQPVEYDQTRDLTESYTTDTPKSHEWRVVAQ